MSILDYDYIQLVARLSCRLSHEITVIVLFLIVIKNQRLSPDTHSRYLNTILHPLLASHSISDGPLKSFNVC